MNDVMFSELMASIEEAGKIRTVRLEASRIMSILEPDVISIREKYEMTQQEFSALLGISIGTLRNWEQGRRKPQGSAKVLLRITEKRPKAILESLV
jgi:putative transcriptional regulator